MHHLKGSAGDQVGQPFFGFDLCPTKTDNTQQARILT